MTYCLAIQVESGLVMASDSRTNAGVDYVSTYSKMHVLADTDDRTLVLLAAGNLATSQAVVNTVTRDRESGARKDLLQSRYLFEVADYIGQISREIQDQVRGNGGAGFEPEASFIIGGQIRGHPHGIYLVYPQGNYISASQDTPYLQIGESKYGKPVLDLILQTDMSLEEAGRCALLSIDSTMRSNLTVGPPIELLLYGREELAVRRHCRFPYGDPYLAALREDWNASLRDAFGALPRFDWEA